MSQTQFYRCDGCGNFIMIIGEKTACTPKCCGQTMTYLEPNTKDAAVEKHIPKVTVEGAIVTVEVGEVTHPMTEDHYIEFIYLETENGGQIRYLKPGQEPRAVFYAAGETPVAAYAYCNLHGLWVKSLAEPEKEPSKTLVAYFSTGHVTQNVAETVASVTGGDLFEIQPAEPYTDDDLDWTDRSARSNQEMHDETARPAMAQAVAEPETYDVIFVGFPIWWGMTPKIVYTFLDSLDLKGKTVVPFCTSGGSKASMVDKDFVKNVHGAGKILDATLLSGRPSEETVKVWTDGLDL